MVDSAFPSPRVPLVGADGMMNSAWYQYFQNEHARTGGNATDKIDSTLTLTESVQTLANGTATSLSTATAEGLFTATQGTTSAGASATIGLQVRAGTGESFRDASIKLSALAGTASRIEITADTVDIDGTILSAGGIATGHLAANAATGTANGAFNSYLSDSDNNWHTLASATGTFAGGDVQIDITIDWDSSAASNKFLKFQLLRDSGAVTNGAWPRITGHGFQVGANQADAKSFSIDDAPSAASHTYDFQYQWVGSSNNQVTFDGTIRATEIKR